MGSGRAGRIARAAAKVAVGAGLTFAGVSHLTVAREEFQAQVPNWFPVDPDVTVLVSGAAEITLGALTLATWRQPARALVGAAAAAFFVVIFSGNIAQYTEHKNGFHLDTDEARLARLFFQPVMVAAALSGGRTIPVLRVRS